MNEIGNIKAGIRGDMNQLRHALHRCGLNDTSSESIMQIVENISIQSSVVGRLERSDTENNKGSYPCPK